MCLNSLPESDFDNTMDEFLKIFNIFEPLSIFHYFHNNKDVVKSLLNERVFENSSTVLHHIVKNNNMFALKLAIEYGADVNIEDCYGRTPIFYAVSSGYKDMVIFLLDMGAIVNKDDNDGKYPRHFAMHNKEISSILKSHMVILNSMQKG